MSTQDPRDRDEAQIQALFDRSASAPGPFTLQRLSAYARAVPETSRGSVAKRMMAFVGVSATVAVAIMLSLSSSGPSTQDSGQSNIVVATPEPPNHRTAPTGSINDGASTAYIQAPEDDATLDWELEYESGLNLALESSSNQDESWEPDLGLSVLHTDPDTQELEAWLYVYESLLAQDS